MSDSNIFVLNQVIDALVDNNQSLVTPLMKLNYFGNRVKNEDLIQYVLKEVNGYRGYENDIPEYRKAPGKLMVNIQAGWYQQTVGLPMGMVEERFREIINTVYIQDGISIVEDKARKVAIESNHFPTYGKPIPIEFLHFIQPGISKLYPDGNVDVVSARVECSAYIFSDVLNAVRTKLLAFTMELAEKFGYNIEILSFNNNREVNNQKIINFMNAEIINTGDGNINNTGTNANITATITVNKGDLKSLNNYLDSLGVEKEDITELNEIVQVEAADLENEKLGEKTNSWIGKVFGKMLSGVGKISTAAAGNLLATGIKLYYGINV